ncbi:acetyltransferase [Ketogulonicigenium vulgare]|uniref:Acetyltransferase, GNAT family protein n=2 Tax=Ketogulonicigenium vulgare TaxID=92945 RepID=F9Y9C6_KETVW|nr:Acetyltransferase, GNAT family protein [Ketogulonicigenium vulgare WSH-001]ALJ82244.1 acetyltransferase [Ketogulonicigenium vulgare]ANW33152.1 acetyltransferase [Ketogulonicigenium vulgare]
MLADDALGATREGQDMAPYIQALRDMQGRDTSVYVGVLEGRIVATYQLIVQYGLSHQGRRVAVLESVRVDGTLRGQGLGAQLVADAETRARAFGAKVLQLTTHKSRARAHAFYERLGFTASHIGYKRELT